MPTVNNNKPVDMKQLWQQVEPAPVVSSAISAMTTSEDGLDRYIYYLVGVLFYRYDTYANTWNKLAAPLATSGFVSMRYSKFGGSFGRIINATTNTARIPGLTGKYDSPYTGYNLMIVSGKGIGQNRKITGSASSVIYDQGVATVAATTYIGDSTKKWSINKWEGYQVRLTYSTGQTQVRKILYNNETTLYVSDANYQPIDSFNNAPFAPAPVATAGAQTHFVIEATDVTLESNWDIIPDGTSRFKIETGGLWLLSSLTTAPFATLQYYDIASDYWVYKTVPTGLILAAFATDGTLERTGEIGGIFESGTATSGTDYRLVDSTKTLVIGDFRNFRIRIIAGTGMGQQRRILTNTASYYEVARKWDIVPDATTVYQVLADKDKIYLAGNGQSMMMQYDVDSDLIIQGAKFDDGITNTLGCRYPGLETPSIAINTGVRNTGGITAINQVPTAGGANYLVGDILTLSATGTNGKVIVTGIVNGGTVASVALYRAGSGYAPVVGRATTGGTGTGCTIEIVSVGIVCLVTTFINHRFVIGDKVILSGDSNYAGEVTIIGSDSLTTFDIVTTAAANMNAIAAQSTTLLVDSTKNWTVNEHVGKIVQTHLVGTAGAVAPRVITANTATTLTLNGAITAAVNGTGRYVIIAPSMFGRDEQFKRIDQSTYGNSNGGGSNTTIVDTTKNWITNQWAGARIRICAGTGRDAYFLITSNTATTLTFPDQTFVPDSTTCFQIQDSYGTCTGAGSTTTLVDSTKKWATNQWAGKKVRITGGAGFGLAAANNEITIVSNNNNTLTFAAITGFAPDATTTYTILGMYPRGSGIEMLWLFGKDIPQANGRYILLARGTGYPTFDTYDLLEETWDYPGFSSPKTETMTTGSYYAYDGKDRVYFAPGVAAGLVQYIFVYDIKTKKVSGFGSVPNVQGTQVLGNRMEIITSPQGIQYLYFMRNTAAEMYRAQIFF